MLFDSKKKRSHPILPEAQKEMNILAEAGFRVGFDYDAGDGKNTYTVVRIIYPMYAEVEGLTTVVASDEDGNYAYDTPDAIGTHCVINTMDKNGVHVQMLPSELLAKTQRKDGKARAGKKTREKHGPHYVEKIPKPIADQIKAATRDGANVKFLTGDGVHEL